MATLTPIVLTQGAFWLDLGVIKNSYVLGSELIYMLLTLWPERPNPRGPKNGQMMTQQPVVDLTNIVV